MPFREVVGHQALLPLIARAVVRESLPPSLIFAGPEGVGKRLVARALAEVLNCQSPIRHRDTDRATLANAFAIDSCGKCPACLRIARGIHPDVIVIEPGDTGAIKIEPIREVINAAGYRPFEGRRRVVIVDDADALVPAAQNALLKLFEEPGVATHFFLVVPFVAALLPTLRSRAALLDALEFGAAASAVRAGGLSPEMFLESSPGRRLEMLKPLIAAKDAAAAAGFLDSLERALRARSGTIIAPEDVFFFETLARCRSYLRDRSPSVKMILEYIAAVFPRAEQAHGPR